MDFLNQFAFSKANNIGLPNAPKARKVTQINPKTSPLNPTSTRPITKNLPMDIEHQDNNVVQNNEEKLASMIGSMDIETIKQEKKGRLKFDDLRKEMLVNYTPIDRIHDLGTGKIDKEKVLISCWNVNGLRRVINSKSLPDYIAKVNPDILCLSEIKITQNQFEEEGDLTSWIPKEYFSYVNCTKLKTGYAGTAILTKFKPLGVKYDLGIPKHDLDGRLLTLEFEKFYMVNVYIPHVGEDRDRHNYRVNEWDIDFRNYLIGLKSKKNVIVCGDFNVIRDPIDAWSDEAFKKLPDFHPKERGNFNKLLDSGFVDTFRQLYPTDQKFTYWSYRYKGRERNKGWRMDYFLVNTEAFKNIEDSIINDVVTGSDHVPLELLYRIK